jgi:fumarate hydratase class II
MRAPPVPRTRLETDSFGAIAVPADRLWGAQTQRSLQNFRIGGQTFPPPFLHALGVVKAAAAVANVELGELDMLSRREQRALVQAAREVAAGRLDAHFPLVVWQTGSGTQTHMNANEVIANRANQILGRPLGSKAPIHPNDHANRGQSSNDVFPTAMHVAAAQQTRHRLLPALDALAAALARKAAKWRSVVKIGRTHLQDATPLTVGQEFSGYVQQLRDAGRAVRAALRPVLQLALGGTAVGTGLNAHPRFARLAARHIAAATRLPFTSAPNKFAALAAHDALVFLSGALKTAAGALTKLAEDIRWLGSGPRCGLGELRLPANEPGSSIMPGKVNPTQCEAMLMVCMAVMSNDAAIGLAGSRGNFELNVCKPLLIHRLLESIDLLADACDSLRVHCVTGLEIDAARIRQLVDRSLMLVTALTPAIGYDRAAEAAEHAHRHGTSLKESVLALGLMSAAEFDRAVQPQRMLGPRLPGARGSRARR